MYRSLSRKQKFGFTLVEVLVTTVVVGTMAAVVIPAMIKLAPAGDPARVVSDLSSIKAGIEVASQHLRPRIPGDIEDLANQISTTDVGLDGTVYSAAQVAKWEGPYLQATTPVSATNLLTDVVFKSGGSASIASALYRCPSASTTSSTDYSAVGGDLPCTIYTTNTTANTIDAYVAVKITGYLPAAGTEFTNLNKIIDGTDETNADDAGLLRQNASGTVFFLTSPYTKP